MVKVGILGLGFMGLTHLKVYREHPHAKLVAVADQVKERLEGDLSGVVGNFMEAGERFDFSGVNTHETVDGLLDDPEVELVSICLPTFTHAEITRKALAKGKHVLCEKPMALREDDLDSMLEAARSSPGLLMIAQCIRFWPEYHRARALIRSGSLGEPRAARFERRSAFPTWGGWLGDESKSGGAIVDLSIHDIDFAHHTFGLPDTVRANGFVDLEKTVDYYQGTLRFGNVPVSIEGSWYPRGDYPFNAGFDILCDEGVLSFNIGLERPLTIFRVDGSSEKPTLAKGDGYSQEIDYVLECIEKGAKPDHSPPEESALSVRLALLLKESRQRDGVEMQVPESWRQPSDA